MEVGRLFINKSINKHMLNRWICGVLGLVVAGVAFLDLSAITLTWTLVIVGLAITISSFWNIITEPEDSRRHGISSHA